MMTATQGIPVKNRRKKIERRLEDDGEGKKKSGWGEVERNKFYSDGSGGTREKKLLLGGQRKGESF
jgi:hypothetical protein